MVTDNPKGENSKKNPNSNFEDSKIEENNIMELEAFERMLAAQNLWDASMAWSIASHLEKNSKNRVLHINGSFHTDFSLGIPEQLNNYSPNLDLLIVTIVPSLHYPNFIDSMIGLEGLWECGDTDKFIGGLVDLDISMARTGFRSDEEL